MSEPITTQSFAQDRGTGASPAAGAKAEATQGTFTTDELCSVNAHIEMLLRNALAGAGRLPRNVGDPPRRGRPPRAENPAP